MGETTFQSQAQTVSLEQSKPQNSPKSDFGQSSEQAVRIGHEQASNANVVSPTQSVPLETPGVIEKDLCRSTYAKNYRGALAYKHLLILASGPKGPTCEDCGAQSEIRVRIDT